MMCASDVKELGEVYIDTEQQNVPPTASPPASRSSSIDSGTDSGAQERRRVSDASSMRSPGSLSLGNFDGQFACQVSNFGLPISLQLVELMQGSIGIVEVGFVVR